MFEQAARVPWLIRLPGQTRPKMISYPVSHIDFVPTLLDLLGQPNPLQCAGRSLLPVINDETAPPQNVFLEWAPNRTKVKKGSSLARRRTIKRAVEESTRTLVSPEGWKLCLRDKDLNELYNLKDDPFEMRNLYSDPGCASVISRLSGEIHRWQIHKRQTQVVSKTARWPLQRRFSNPPAQLGACVFSCFLPVRFALFSPHRCCRRCSAPKPGKQKQKGYDYCCGVLISHRFRPQFVFT